MKKTLIFALLLGLILCSAAVAAERGVYDIPVKTLYSAPSEDSNVVYNIPIEVKLLDISEDGNWYKVQISYNIGPLGYTYVGWSNIPVADILSERETPGIAAKEPENLLP